MQSALYLLPNADEAWNTLGCGIALGMAFVTPRLKIQARWSLAANPLSSQISFREHTATWKSRDGKPNLIILVPSHPLRRSFVNMILGTEWYTDNYFEIRSSWVSEAQAAAVSVKREEAP